MNEPSDAAAKPRHSVRRDHRHPASRPVHRQPRHHSRSRHPDADAPLGEPGVAHLRLRIPGAAAAGDGRPELDRAVLSRRGHCAGGGASPLFLLPARRSQPVSHRLGSGQRRFRCSRARDRCGAPPRAAGGPGEAAASAADAAGKTARRRDGEPRQREFSDRKGPGIVWSPAGYRHARNTLQDGDAADAAFDIARVVGGISTGAASEREYGRASGLARSLSSGRASRAHVRAPE